MYCFATSDDNVCTQSCRLHVPIEWSRSGEMVGASVKEGLSENVRSINHTNQISSATKHKHELEVEIIKIWRVHLSHQRAERRWGPKREGVNKMACRWYRSESPACRRASTMSVLFAMLAKSFVRGHHHRRRLSLISNQFYCRIFINRNVLAITSPTSERAPVPSYDSNSNLP